MATLRPWGSMADSRSRLRRLAGRIYREELLPLYPVTTKLGTRRLRTAASYLAQAQMVMDQIKGDDRVSPKRHVLLLARAEQMLTRLAEAEARARPALTPADLLREVGRR